MLLKKEKVNRCFLSILAIPLIILQAHVKCPNHLSFPSTAVLTFVGITCLETWSPWSPSSALWQFLPFSFGRAVQKMKPHRILKMCLERGTLLPSCHRTNRWWMLGLQKGLSGITAAWIKYPHDRIPTWIFAINHSFCCISPFLSGVYENLCQLYIWEDPLLFSHFCPATRFTQTVLLIVSTNDILPKLSLEGMMTLFKLIVIPI